MKRYKVTAENSTVLGHAPGEEFEDDIPQAQEERLIKRGFIAPVQAKPKHEAESGTVPTKPKPFGDMPGATGKE